MLSTCVSQVSLDDSELFLQLWLSQFCKPHPFWALEVTNESSNVSGKELSRGPSGPTTSSLIECVHPRRPTGPTHLDYIGLGLALSENKSTWHNPLQCVLPYVSGIEDLRPCRMDCILDLFCVCDSNGSFWSSGITSQLSLRLLRLRDLRVKTGA